MLPLVNMPPRPHPSHICEESRDGSAPGFLVSGFPGLCLTRGGTPHLQRARPVVPLRLLVPPTYRVPIGGASMRKAGVAAPRTGLGTPNFIPRRTQELPHTLRLPTPFLCSWWHWWHIYEETLDGSAPGRVGFGTLFAPQTIARREGKECLGCLPTPTSRSEAPHAERLASFRQSILFLPACIRNPRCTKACQSP